MTTSARTLSPCRAGANRNCRSACSSACSRPSSSRGTHSRSHPGPATPARRSMPSSAGSSGGGTGSASGSSGARHDERAAAPPRPGHPAENSTPRPGRPDPSRPPPGQLPVAAHRLGQGAQQVVDRAAPAGVLGEVGEQLVRGAADRVHRGAGPPGRPARERSGARRGDDDRDRRGPDDPALGTGREPAEQEQQRDQPEQHRRADRRHRRGGDQHPDARPRACALAPAASPASTARPASAATTPGASAAPRNSTAAPSTPTVTATSSPATNSARRARRPGRSFTTLMARTRHSAVRHRGRHPRRRSGGAAGGRRPVSASTHTGPDGATQAGRPAPPRRRSPRRPRRLPRCRPRSRLGRIRTRRRARCHLRVWVTSRIVWPPACSRRNSSSTSRPPSVSSAPVGSSASSSVARWPAPGRSPGAGAARRRAPPGSRRPGRSRPSRSSRSRARASAARRAAARRQRGQHHVLQGRHPVEQVEELEHDPDVAPAQPGEPVLVESVDALPATSMVPSSGGSSPAIMFSSVDFPQPDGPMTATNSPART